jgi:homoserine dehydrogenase
VLGDVLDAAHNLRAGGPGRAPALARSQVRPMPELTSQYYVTMEVEDRPGVLAAVAGAFAEEGVSIRSMEQVGLGDEARMVFITHTALERAMQQCLERLRRLDAVETVGGLIRVIEDD